MKKVNKLVQNQINRAFNYFQNGIWQISLDQLNPFQAFLIKQLRICILAIQGALKNKIFMLAPALTFFSLLSIVPAVALALGIAKGFGLESYLEQQLQLALAGREEVFNWIMELTGTFFQNIEGSAVAVVGLGVLIYTLSMLLTTVEKIFNQIWQVRHGRTWIRRLTDYFAIIFLGPLFLIAAGAVTVFLSTRIQLHDGSLISPFIDLLLRVSPYLLVWVVFIILYMVMPNTRVHFYPALVNGIIAGTAFQLIQWAYLAFQIGAASLGALYGSFAALPLLMIWMQVSWYVVLFGAELTHAAQNNELFQFGPEPKEISSYKYKILSLYILYRLLKNFLDSSSPSTAPQVSKQLGIPGPLVEKILNNLKEVKLLNLVLTEEGHESVKAYQPALDVHVVTVAMAWKKLEYHGYNELVVQPSSIIDSLTDTLEEMGKAIEQSELNRLLIDL